MKVLFIVESPLQLLNAYEASHFFDYSSKSIYLIRFTGEKVNDAQLRNMIKLLKIKHYSAVLIKKKKGIFDFLKLFYYKYIYVGKKIEKIFLGNYESKFMHLFLNKTNNSKIVLIDDGAKSIYIQNNFSKSFNFDWFTVFNFRPKGNQKIYINKYEKISQENYKIDYKKVLFIGMKLSEVGIMGEKEYIQLVKKIVNNFPDKIIIYVPHRGESEGKLEKIKKISNKIVIQNLDYPVELYGFNFHSIPKTIVSFYSTALYTMKNIYKVNAISYRFNYSGRKYRNNIKIVYDFYQKNMDIIDL